MSRENRDDFDPPNERRKKKLLKPKPVEKTPRRAKRKLDKKRKEGR